MTAATFAKCVASIVVGLAALGALGCSSVSAPDVASARALVQTDPPVVIRQVYGGGGNSGAPWTNDFVELFNRTAADIPLSGMSIQYASATGTGNFGVTNQITILSGVIPAGGSFLVQEAGGANGTPLPTPNLTSNINMSATAGKVALVTGTTSLGCNGGSTPCTPDKLALIMDLVGYGTGGTGANFFEGSGAAPTLSNALAALRAGGGCTDTNDNSADFVAGPPVPHNMDATNVCGGGTDAGQDAAADAEAGTGSSMGACGSPATAIGAVQGSGAASPMVGSIVEIEGVVVGDFQDQQIAGFFMQEEGDGDGDPTTSDGIFVTDPAPSIPVAAGNVVRVRGQVAEVSDSTQLVGVTGVVVCPGAPAATVHTVSFPVGAVSDLERYEGMLVTISQTLTVTGNFDLGRFGSLDMSASPTGHLLEPTSVATPGAAALAIQDSNDRSRIILDDLSNAQDPNPMPYKDSNSTRRTGDTIPSLTGILDGRFSAYRIYPTVAPVFASGNPRPAAPPGVGGRLRVAAANVLNFFTTLDTGPTGCGPTGALECRGANNANEFNRQREKLLNALQGINGDVVGLMEVENNTSAATQSIVDGLNTRLGGGTYAFIDTGTIGTDAIKVAIIYKPAKVSPTGSFALLTTAVDPEFIDTKNRPSLAQTFTETATGEKFTVVVNHLKSKGSDCNDVGDPDINDGQGNCNQTRTKAAGALLRWIATDPTRSGDPDYLVVGDMNAYAKEDPITTFKAGGLRALLETFVAASAYSYQFNGQFGYLDHALATASMANQVTGATEWHNNCDEPTALDYNTEFKTDDPFNITDPFRASDHDPLVVGLNLGAPASVPAGGATHLAALAAFLLASGAWFARGFRRRA
jgi:predicted extracellular nuclease